MFGNSPARTPSSRGSLGGDGGGGGLGKRGEELSDWNEEGLIMTVNC